MGLKVEFAVKDPVFALVLYKPFEITVLTLLVLIIENKIRIYQIIVSFCKKIQIHIINNVSSCPVYYIQYNHISR